MYTMEDKVVFGKVAMSLFKIVHKYISSYKTIGQQERFAIHLVKLQLHKLRQTIIMHVDFR